MCGDTEDKLKANVLLKLIKISEFLDTQESMQSRINANSSSVELVVNSPQSIPVATPTGKPAGTSTLSIYCVPGDLPGEYLTLNMLLSQLFVAASYIFLN